jgi:hypothetical protein
LSAIGRLYEEELKAIYRSRLRIGQFLNWFVGLKDQSFLRLPIFSTLPVLLKRIVKEICSPPLEAAFLETPSELIAGSH